MEDEDGDKSNNDMRNGLAKSGDVGEGEVGVSDVLTTYIAAPNILVNDKCTACDKDVDSDTQAIKCWECKNHFHAIGCSQDAFCVSANSAFTGHLSPAVKNAGTFTTRFGRFLWVCDFCLTEIEKKKVATVDDRVSILDKKIDNFNISFKNELKEMKNLLVSLAAPALQPSEKEKDETVLAVSATKETVWDDKHRVEKLRQKVVIKGLNGKAADAQLLEKTCVDNGISVIYSHQVRNSVDTAFTLKSPNDAKLLEEKLSENLPGHKVDRVATRTPTINVTGLWREYDHAELATMIKQQNPSIRDVLESDMSEDDKKFDVVAVKPIRSNSAVFRATIRVSNVIRSVIANHGDRLFVGTQTICRVWDNFYVSRCYKCQQFGHMAQNKEGVKCANAAVCGHCAGQHETRECGHKPEYSRSSASCINCKTAQLSPYNHPAYWHGCPVLGDYQKKLRSSIPFYQGSH
jgi:hypothetical protein